MKDYVITTTIEANDVVHALKRLQNYLNGEVDSENKFKVSAIEFCDADDDEDSIENISEDNLQPPKSDGSNKEVENRNKPNHSAKPASVGAVPTIGMGNLFGGTSWGK